MDSTERRNATDAETACFEAGIKFGSLYHQFAGTPVSPRSADSLERAIEESIENQPHCASVTVEILPERLEDAIRRTSSRDVGYTELTGRLMKVEMVIDFEGTEVRTRMEMESGYPMMRIESIRD